MHRTARHTIYPKLSWQDAPVVSEGAGGGAMDVDEHTASTEARAATALLRPSSLFTGRLSAWLRNLWYI